LRRVTFSRLGRALTFINLGHSTISRFSYGLLYLFISECLQSAIDVETPSPNRQDYDFPHAALIALYRTKQRPTSLLILRHINPFMCRKDDAFDDLEMEKAVGLSAKFTAIDKFFGARLHSTSVGGLYFH
jgi:hypothetical protein